MTKYRTIDISDKLIDERKAYQLHLVIYLLREGLWQKGTKSLEDGFTIHHIDFNSRNNDPDNLMLVSESEHHKIHWRESRRKGSRNGLEEYRQQRTPEEKRARMLKAKAVAVEKMLREGPTPAQLEGLKKARAHAYGGTRVPMKELTAEEIAEIRRLYPAAKGKYNQAKALRVRFGISRGRLLRIASS